MKKIIFLFVVLILMPAMLIAATMTGAKYTSAKITYQSVDVRNEAITLSAMVYFPTSTQNGTDYKTISFVLMNCHATISNDAYCPTGTDPQMSQVSYMTSESAMVVCPDYIGFGESKETVHPYMCQTLTARNVLDCYKAAVNEALSRGIKFDKNCYTLNAGYSQGGGVSLAFHRYMEKEASEADKALVNLRESLCGAGTYNMLSIVDEYEKMPAEKLTYPSIVPYLLSGYLQTYGESVLHGLKLEDFLKESLLNSGIIEKIEAKQTNIDDINAEILELYGGKCSFYDMVRDEYKDRNSVIYRALHKALSMNNLLEDWTPEHPITFYHFTDDEVVPYSQTTEALQALKGGATLTLQKAEDLKDGSGLLSFSGSYGDWNLAFSGAAGALGYNLYLEKNHRGYGTRFYLAMFADILQKATSQQAASIAASQYVPTSLHLAATDNVVPADALPMYDRIDMVRDVHANLPTVMVFPAKVDGYYFGVNAVRKKVKYMQQGFTGSYELMTEDMQDEEDFLPSQPYLVVPTQDCSNVVSITAGIPTTVDASGVILKAQDVTGYSDVATCKVTLSKIGDYNYATLFVPFAVRLSEGVKAYTLAEQENKTYAKYIAETEIPANTAVILRGKETTNAAMEILASTDATVSTALQGTNVEIATPDNVYTFTSEGESLALYRYTGTTLAANKAYYKPAQSNNAKVFEIYFPDDESNNLDAINAVVSVESIDGIYSLSGVRNVHLHRGLNIVRMKNGEVKKLWMR